MRESLGVPVSFGRCINESLTIGRWRHGDVEVAVRDTGNSVPIIVNLSNGQRVEWLYKGRWARSHSFPIGSFAVVDPEVGCGFAISGAADILQLYLPLDGLGETVGAEKTPSVATRVLAEDPLIERCAMQALVAMHTREDSHPLLLSDIAQRLAEGIIVTGTKPVARGTRGLSASTLRRVKDFINHRVLTESTSSITLRELAQQANLSLFHFAREFRRSTGVTPYAYALSQRLKLARSIIASTPAPISDVARQTGFKSRAHFTALFHRQVGVSPVALRRAIHIE